MHIPAPYDQYTNEKALFIISGSRSARLFAAHDGEINEIAHLDTPHPTYSDREGFFEHGGSGASGAVREENKQEMTAQFLKLLSQHLSAASQESYQTVIVCAPSYILPDVITAIPAPLANRIRTTIEGNFTSSAPLDLIKSLHDTLEKSRTSLNESIASPEAQKLLHKTDM